MTDVSLASPLTSVEVVDQTLLRLVDAVSSRLAVQFAAIEASQARQEHVLGESERELKGFSGQLGELAKELTEVKSDLSDLRRHVVRLGDRVSDIDSGQRSRQLASHYGARTVGTSPSGGAFSEREQDYKPRSIFSQ